jgi:hypothetical protein
MPSKKRGTKRVFGVMCLGSVSILLGGCGQKTNNLRNVDCNKHNSNFSGTTAIVVNASDAIKLEDEMVFVCAGEKVRWEAGSGVTSIDVQFPSSAWPFTQPFENNPLHGDGQTPTPAREVGPLLPSTRANAFKYQIHVVANGNPINLDPHIIRMGP